MTLPADLEAAIEEYHAAVAGFIKGDPSDYKQVFSHQDDVSVANPFRPIARGWDEVEETFERASSTWREGEIGGFERAAELFTDDLAYILEFERYRGKMGGSPEMASIELRVTSVLRPEDGTWKVVHRHADPITDPRPPESVIRD
jgi:ketosteroid isomerase-like protein